MNERRGSLDTTAKSGEISIAPHQKGLCRLYLSAKHEEQRQGILARMYKEAIVERSDDLIKDYKDFSKWLVSNYPPRVIENPSVIKRSNRLRKADSVSFISDPILISLDKKHERKIIYRKDEYKGKLRRESIKIENPIHPGRFIELNLITNAFEMRDANSMQSLAHGEPKIVPLVDNSHSHSFSDILDNFSHEKRVLSIFAEGSKIK